MSQETERLHQLAAEAQSRYSMALGLPAPPSVLQLLKQEFHDAYRAWQRKVNNEREADQIIHGASFQNSEVRIDPRDVNIVPSGTGTATGMTYDVRVRQERAQQERDRDWRRRAYREEPPEQTIMGFPYREVKLELQVGKPEPKGEPMPEPGERFIELDDEE